MVTKTHGMKGTPTYSSWRSMKSRCLNPKHKSREYYSDAGVSVCSRWLNFAEFFADMGVRPAGTTLDRWPDKCGNYEPGNCRWATPAEQASNRSSTTIIDGVPMFEAARAAGRNLSQVRRRIARGLTLDQALSKPLQPGVPWAGKKGVRPYDRRAASRRAYNAKFYQFDGRDLLLMEVAEILHVPYDTLHWRVKRYGFEAAAAKPYKPRNPPHANT